MSIRSNRNEGHPASAMAVLVMLTAVLIPVGPVVHAEGARPSLVLRTPLSAEAGDVFRVEVVAENATDLAAFETLVRFDPTAAQYLGVTHAPRLAWSHRYVQPLASVESADGITLAAYSCQADGCSAASASSAHRQDQTQGSAVMATLEFTALKAGAVEIALAHTVLVDEQGAPLVAGAGSGVRVKIGSAGPDHAVPALRGTGAPAARTPALIGLVERVDATEVAIEWGTARERGQHCATFNCIDIGDVQAVAAQISASDFPVASVVGGGAYVVNSNADTVDSVPGDGICSTSAGVCTLRAALDESSRDAGPSLVNFNIPGTGPHTIQVGTVQLPTINDLAGGVTIDGYSQPGSVANTDPFASNAVIKIQIRGNGNSATGVDGLFINSPNNVVKGIAMYNMRGTIRLYGPDATGNVVVGSFVGTDAAGVFTHTVQDSSSLGFNVQVGAAANFIGLPNLADRNVISGNGHQGVGIYDDATDGNIIQNNIIGLSPDGTRRLGNLRHGIDVNTFSANNVVGGTAPLNANVVSGNYLHGIEVSHGALTNNNSVIGNFVGTAVTGTSALPHTGNTLAGINVEDSVTDTIVTDNVIGNNGGGLLLAKSATGTRVERNRIGLSATGTAMSNGDYGIQADSRAADSVIGPDNIIANHTSGIRMIDGGTVGTTVTHNSIYANSGLGIDIDPIGSVNLNDAGDVDTGPNDRLNFPIITSASPSAVSGTACAGCVVEVFIADGAATAHGDGQTFIGSAVADAAGAFTVAVSLTSDQVVTSTATDSIGNTSEFSLNALVTINPSDPILDTDSFTRNVSRGWGSAAVGGAWTVAKSPTSFAVNGTRGTINVPVGGNRSVDLLSVSSTDVDMYLSVATDTAPQTGTGEVASLVARRASATTQYRARVRIGPGGEVFVAATRLSGSSSEVFVAPEVKVVGLIATPTNLIRVRFVLTGTSPTTINIKAWAATQTEPAAWNVTTTDSTAVNQVSGAIGVYTFIPSTYTSTVNSSSTTSRPPADHWAKPGQPASRGASEWRPRH